MKYSKFDIQRVKNAADIRDFIPNTTTIARRLYAKCPQCKGEGKKGMLITHNRSMDLAKCFNCGFTINGAISAVEHYYGLKFDKALEKVADQYGIHIEPEKAQEKRCRKQMKDSVKGSFCFDQLKASGLTIEDVTAKVLMDDGQTWQLMPTMRRGAMIGDKIDDKGDEMLIFYYDLYGRPMKYASRGAAGSLKDYVRVRWSNPDIHLGKDQKPMKYMSPKGSDVRLYITQKIRDAFAAGEHIETLIIQEGEKKAEKACKHGIMSVGIQGIQCIGNKDSGLISDLQILIKKCGIKNVVLLFDSDWDHLSKNISDTDHIDQRPNQFAKAAIKFKSYVETLYNVGCAVDVWFGHINENEAGEKGIDDLLSGSMKDSADDLAKEIGETMHTHDGHGEHANFHKISTLADLQIMDYWHLRDRDKFFEKHHDRIKDLKTFKFGRVIYRANDSGGFEKSSISGDAAEFWKVEVSEKGKKDCQMKIGGIISFLEANGFHRIISSKLNMNMGFAKIDKGVAAKTEDVSMRDFVFDYVVQNCKDPDVIEMFFDQLSSKMDSGRLERLSRRDINRTLDPEYQMRYYNNGEIRITSRGVELMPMSSIIWESDLIKRSFERIPVIKRCVKKEDGEFELQFTEAGYECDFLNFIMNTSFFWGRNKTYDDLSMEERDQFKRHILSKLTTIGFLLTDFKHPSERKAVIAMDAKLSEVGKSDGRSGKSMIGDAVSRILEQTVVDGKKLKNDDDYIYSGVTPKTRNVFIDDVQPNFDFGRFYQAICGPLNVNPKGLARFVLPFEESPKFLITTNHTIADNSPSSQARQAVIMFSDWYNIKYTPRKEFGHLFFDDWDLRQWVLFDNLMAECVMLYLRSMQEEWQEPGCGIVAPPMKRINDRRLRQQMGDAFLDWAEVYFDPNGVHINERWDRKEVFENFCTQFAGVRTYTTPNSFKSKIHAYCEYKGFHFNPTKCRKDGKSYKEWISEADSASVFIGERDVSGGKEFFMVATPEYAEKIAASEKRT